MLQALVTLLSLTATVAFSPVGYSGLTRMHSKTTTAIDMALKDGEKVLVIGVAADSGCGKSTFMRRLTKVFGGANVGPLGGGFDKGSWETNTLVSDKTTVICLDDYHANDRAGRKVSGLTALNVKEQNFDLMAEQIAALKAGKSIAKPIYNHVNGTLDTPETVEPTPIVIIEGLHPFVDPRVRELLDFSIYLDISDDIKFAWKIQRDMAERGWTREQVLESIEQRKPDFSAYVEPQMKDSDVVLSVLPSDTSKLEVGKHLKVKMIQRKDKKDYKCASGPAGVMKPAVKSAPDCEVTLGYGTEKFYDKDCEVITMDGKLADINDFKEIEKLLQDTAAKSATELADEVIKVGADSPGALDGTGLFQTLTSLKLREYYETIMGAKVAA